MAEQQVITVRLIRSMIGHPEKHRAVLRGMGLTRMHKAVTLPDTPQVWGMIDKVKHMVRVEAS